MADREIVQDIRAHLAAGTPRPWRPGKTGGSIVADWALHNGHEDTKEHRVYYGGALVAESASPENIALIAAAPDLLDRAAKEIERLQGELDQYMAEAETLRTEEGVA